MELTNFSYGEEKRQQMLKSFGIDIIEKSEGSRGGKVIGHTKSGKAIYESHSHPEHKDFTHQDHLDAKVLHEKKAYKYNGDKNNAGLGRAKRMKAAQKEIGHKQQAEEHGKSAFENSKVIEKAEKGGKLDTSKLVLKEVSVGGKMMNRWVDPNKNDQEHAEHGSKIDFEHKGEKKTGTVGTVLKTGEYHIKGDDGKSYAKHPHQFDSPHEGIKEKDVTDGEPTKKRPEDHASETSDGVLNSYVGKKDADPKLKDIATRELESRKSSDKGETDAVSKDAKGAGDEKKAGDDKLKEPEGKATPEDVKDMDNEINDEDDVNERFKSFEQIVGMVAKGTVKSALAYGTGGVGKTFGAFQKLEKMVNPVTKKPFVEFDESKHDIGSTDYDYIKITGKSTAAGAYRAMYEHNGKLLMFDDCDSVLKDPNAIDMLKGALDSTGDGTISNLSDRPLKDASGAAIPNRFKFTGRAMFISNLPSKDIPQPLRSRSLGIDLTMDTQQTIDRIKEISKDKKGGMTNIKLQDANGNNISYDTKDMEEAIKFLDKYKDKTEGLNVRTLGNIVRVIHDSREEGEDADNWQGTAKRFLLSKAINDEIDLEMDQTFEEIMNYEENQIEKAFEGVINYDPIQEAYNKLSLEC